MLHRRLDPVPHGARRELQQRGERRVGGPRQDVAARGLDEEVHERDVDREGLRGGCEGGDAGAVFGGDGGEDVGVGLGDGGEGVVEAAEVGVYCCF